MARIISFLLLMIISLELNADNEQIAISIKNQGGTHSEYYIPADMPDVYFNSSTQEIIIEADGFASYYDVEIISQTSLLTVILTQIDGYGESIDVSSLPLGDYTIVMTSSFNNEYEGQFSNY